MLMLLPNPTIAFDHNAAVREGWDVFHCDPDPDGRRQIQLQRLDAPDDGAPPFPDDRDAWEHGSPVPAPGPPCTAPRSTRWTTPSAC